VIIQSREETIVSESLPGNGGLSPPVVRIRRKMYEIAGLGALLSEVMRQLCVVITQRIPRVPPGGLLLPRHESRQRDSFIKFLCSLPGNISETSNQRSCKACVRVYIYASFLRYFFVEKIGEKCFFTECPHAKVYPMEHIDILIPIGIMLAFVIFLLIFEPMQRWKFKRDMELRDRRGRQKRREEK